MKSKVKRFEIALDCLKPGLTVLIGRRQILLTNSFNPHESKKTGQQDFLPITSASVDRFKIRPISLSDSAVIV